MTSNFIFLSISVLLLLCFDDGLSINYFPKIDPLPRKLQMYRRRLLFPSNNPAALIATNNGPSPQGLADIHEKNLAGQEQELLIQLGVDSKWEQYLLPGPMAVATLGQLIVLSAKRDFPLKGSDKFKYLRFDHFSPALVQVVDEALLAFETADKNMRLIKLSADEFPKNVREALSYLGSANPSVIQKFLPIPIKALQATSQECVQYAKEIDNAFIYMMELLSEVDESLSATQGYYREGLLNLTRERANAEQQKKFLTSMRDQVKDQFTKVSQELDHDRYEYEKALKHIPTGWNAIFQGFVSQINPMQIAGMFMGDAGPLTGIMQEAMPDIGGSVSQLLGNLGANELNLGLDNAVKDIFGGKYKDARAQADHNSGLISNYNAAQSQVLNQAQNMFHGLNGIIPEIQDFLNKIIYQGSNNTNVMNQKQSLIGYLDTYKIGAEKLLENLATKIETPWKNSMSTLLSEFGKGIEDVVGQLSFNGSFTDVIENAIKNGLSTLQGLQQQASSLVSIQGFKNGAASSGQVTTGKTPSGQYHGTGYNERMIAQQRESRLDDTEHRYDAYFDKLQNANKQLNAVMEKLSNLKTEVIDFNQINEILSEAINAIANLKMQFDKMVRFFQMIDGITSVTLQKSATDFVSIAQTLGEDPDTTSSLLNDDPAHAIRNSLVTDSIRIATVSKFLYMLSDVYGTISDKYIQGRIANITALQNTPKDKMDAMLENLFIQSKAAQTDILNMVNDKRTAFKQSISNQKGEIDQIYQALGVPTEEDKKSVDNAKAMVNIQSASQPKGNAINCYGMC